MNNNPVVVIAGATGLVGSEMLSTLENSKIDPKEVRLLASKDSEGELYRFRNDEVRVQTLSAEKFHGVDIALFATGKELSEKYVPIAAQAGAYSIDNSSFFRMKEGVPLIVPEVNPEALKEDTMIIANPNCSTSQLVVALKPLLSLGMIKRVVVSTYQSVSGAGKAALDELWGETLSIFQQKNFEREQFQHQIAFNVIPQIDSFHDSGYTLEELKVIQETKKILNLPSLNVTCTAVRVPVFHSHSESVNVEFEGEVSERDLINVLRNAKGVQLYEEVEEYPLPVDVTGTDPVHIGRIRRDSSVPCGYDMWIVADNLRKGAALNAIQIAELIVTKFGSH